MGGAIVTGGTGILRAPSGTAVRVDRRALIDRAPSRSPSLLAWSAPRGAAGSRRADGGVIGPGPLLITPAEGAQRGARVLVFCWPGRRLDGPGAPGSLEWWRERPSPTLPALLRDVPGGRGVRGAPRVVLRGGSRPWLLPAGEGTWYFLAAGSARFRLTAARGLAARGRGIRHRRHHQAGGGAVASVGLPGRPDLSMGLADVLEALGLVLRGQGLNKVLVEPARLRRP